MEASWVELPDTEMADHVFFLIVFMLTEGFSKQTAERAYEEAAALVPEDPVPISNLSSVKFEQGKYAAAIELASKCLELLSKADGGDGADSERRRRALYNRLAKCYMFESRHSEAGGVLDEITDQALK